MAKFTIGDKTHIVEELNFLAVERAWPYILEAMVSQDPIKGVGAAIHVLAAGIMETDGFDPKEYGMENGPYTPNEIFHELSLKLKKQCKASQIGELKDAVLQVIEESGLTEEGELKAAMGTANLGTATSDPSSLNSSPPAAKGAPGTA